MMKMYIRILNFLLQAHVNKNKKIKIYFPIDSVNKVTIIRINDVAYYSIDNNSYEILMDFSNIPRTFNVPVAFGGVIKVSDTGAVSKSRPFTGIMSNIDVKFVSDDVTLEQYQAALTKQ